MTLTPRVRSEVSPDGTQLTVSTTSRFKTVRVRLKLRDGNYHPEAGQDITHKEPWRIPLRLDTLDHLPTVQVMGSGWQDV